MTKSLNEINYKDVQMNFKVEISIEIRKDKTYEIRWGIKNSYNPIDSEIVMKAFIEVFAEEVSKAHKAMTDKDSEVFDHLTKEQKESVFENIKQDLPFIQKLQETSKFSHEGLVQHLAYIYKKTNEDKQKPNLILPPSMEIK